MNRNIKVAGYVKKELYNGNIEYRNFSPDLVGLQLTGEGGTPLFTMGNFSITTNMDPKQSKSFATNKFSDFYSLDNLTISPEQSNILLNDNAGVFLNLDKSKLKNYALFGSLTEYVRVNLEEIITNWPASLFLTPFTVNDYGVSVVMNTFENYNYDNISDLSTFRVNTNLIKNKFDINFLKNGTIINTFNESNNLRNITVNYKNYTILINGLEYNLVGFVGSDKLKNDYLELTVKGDVFNGISNDSSFHIKPSRIFEDLFFNGLGDFSNYLLNRQTIPLYKASFDIPKTTEQGVTVYSNDSVVWPVTDGYNIDFDSGEYITYASKLLNIAENNDLVSSNLMNRFLVSESISAFDTTPVHLAEEHMDTSGQKVNKTLQIYGVNFDEINNYITGISFANTVTYDKQNNTPDKYLKDLARVLGWDLVSSVLENDLLANYVKTSDSEFAGQGVGFTAVDADTELWRRLILNTPWIWKSKGARKSIEFLLKFIGTPNGLVQFNEYVYLVDKPINVTTFLKVLELNGLEPNLSGYPVDYDGYPYFLPNTPNMYFQSDGLWYRETGGENSTIDILNGNNPHVGKYDGGSRYINQLKNLIPDFSAVTITGETTVTGSTNLFTNYGLGEITGYSGDTFVDVTNEDGTDLNSCVIYKAEIVHDPIPSEVLDACGCPSDLSDDALSICIKKLGEEKPPESMPCDGLLGPPTIDPVSGYYIFQYEQYLQNGDVYQINGQTVPRTTPFIDRECCTALGGVSGYGDTNSTILSYRSGYYCCATGDCACKITCNWYLQDQPIMLNLNGTPEAFLAFTTYFGEGINKVVSTDASFCPTNWTTPVFGVTDPYTNEVGVACKLIPGYPTMNYATLVNIFQGRALKNTCCSLDFSTGEPLSNKIGMFNGAMVTTFKGYNEYRSFSETFTEQNGYSYSGAKCGTLDPVGFFGGPSQYLAGSLAPQEPTPYCLGLFRVGTRMFMDSSLTIPYSTLKGIYSVKVGTLSQSSNFGLSPNTNYVVEINGGYIKNIHTFNSLPSCSR